MSYSTTYTADDFCLRTKPAPIKYEIERKIDMLKGFGFITKQLKNETAVRVWLSSFKTERDLTKALHPVVRFEKTLEEVMNS
jgi:hypothetical protein